MSKLAVNPIQLKTIQYQSHVGTIWYSNDHHLLYVVHGPKVLKCLHHLSGTIRPCTVLHTNVHVIYKPGIQALSHNLSNVHGETPKCTTSPHTYAFRGEMASATDYTLYAVQCTNISKGQFGEWSCLSAETMFALALWEILRVVYALLPGLWFYCRIGLLLNCVENV